MAPLDYIQARENKIDSCIVDGFPYLPGLTVDVNNVDTVKSVASEIMLYGEAEKSQHDLSKLSVSKVSGGITNALFKVSGLPGSIHQCLIRVFGAEGMIDRDIENSTYAALSAVYIAPPYYGRFANGRIEGWCGDDVRALQTEELSKANIAQHIAQAMAELHVGFVIPESLQNVHDVKKPSLWTQLFNWHTQAVASKFRTQGETEAAITLELHKIDQELKWLQVDIIPSDAAVVFAHNDLLAANVLYNDELDANHPPKGHMNSVEVDCDHHTRKVIQLIDFEYGGVNYACFDIANHFNEYAGGPPDHATPDYSLLPNEEGQRDFCKVYLEAAKKVSSDHAIVKMTVSEMVSQVQGFIMANHLYWGLWAVNQAAGEGCEKFNYMLYAQNRIQEYWKCKNNWVSLEN